MMPNIPLRMTVCGRIANVPHRSDQLAPASVATLQDIAQAGIDSSSLVQLPRFTYVTQRSTDVFDTFGVGNKGPDVLGGCPCVVVSSCSNALFFIEGPALPPIGSDFLIHMECVLLDGAALGDAAHEFYATLIPAVQRGTDYVRIEGLERRGRLPCYLVRSWSMTLPPVGMLGGAFAFTQRSVLDEFPVRARPMAVASTGTTARGARPSGAPSTSMLTVSTLEPSWVHGFSSRDTWDLLGMHSGVDSGMEGPLLMNTVLCQETVPVISMVTVDPHGGVNVVEPVYVPGSMESVYKIIDAVAAVQTEMAQRVAADGMSKPLPNGQSQNDVAWAALLGRALTLRAAGTGGDTVADAWIARIVMHVTAWVMGTVACRHGLVLNDDKGRLRRGFQKLATRLYSSEARALEVWADFMEHKSLARIVFPWLNDFTLDPQSTDAWKVAFDAMHQVAAHFAPEIVCARADVEDVDDFKRHQHFEYQRRAFDYYINKLVDRTRFGARDTADENKVALTRFYRDGTLPDQDQADGGGSAPGVAAAGGGAGGGGGGGGGGDEGGHDTSYYAQRGQHGMGHLFVQCKVTDEPFDYDNGRMLLWMLSKPDPAATCEDPWTAPPPMTDIKRGDQASVDHSMEALLPFCNIHSPLVAEVMPGGARLGYRVTATTDFAIMYYLRNSVRAMALRRVKNLADLERWLETNRAKVFEPSPDGEPREIVMSNGRKLTLSDEQQRVFRNLASSPLSIITGGAGTGKSTMIAALSCLFSGSNERVAEQGKPDEQQQQQQQQQPPPKKANKRKEKPPLANWLQVSPYGLFMGYGKVVSNFTRIYGLFATTLHYASAIQNKNFWHDDRRVFLDAASPSHARVAIVDEISVCSLTHMVLLFNACPRLEKLILVGDINQMQSIERGNVGEVFMRLYGHDERITTRLTHNYRLTSDTSASVQMAQRTHLAFQAIIEKTNILKEPTVFGPYADDGAASALPAICQVKQWDTVLIKRALARAPMLLLPHVNGGMEKSGDPKGVPIKSLEATMDRLLDVVGRRPADWDAVQVMTQRNAEVNAITHYLTHVLFPTIPVNYGKLPYNDIYVGEKVIITQRTPAYAPNNSKCTISKNDVRIIKSIVDCDQIKLPCAEGEVPMYTYKNHVQRPSTRKFVPGSFAFNHKRIITFSDDYYVVCDYAAPSAINDIKFLRRGICVTNSSMQGSSATLAVTYLREGVSHTYDRTQFYTSVSRMEERCVIISTPQELLKVIQRDPPVRNNQFNEVLATVNLFPAPPPPPFPPAPIVVPAPCASALTLTCMDNVCKNAQ